MHRFLSLAAVLLFNLLASAADMPNVLFIISDDLTAEALSCYGNANCKTPNIDALAKRGTLFSKAYCQYPVCGPSRAALMSGMYSQCVGVIGNGSSDRFTEALGNRASMSQHFGDHGYHTARVSKIYHMRIPGDITAGVHGPDHAASWKERHSFKCPEWMTEGEAELLSKGKVRKDPDKHYALGFGGAFYVVKGSSDGAEQCDVQATDRAIEIMREHRNDRFFMAVGLIRPHVPLVAPKSFFEPYPPGKMKLMETRQNDRDDIPQAGISRTTTGLGLTTKEKKQKVLSAYYASVAFMDAQVGRLIASLEELGIADNTIIVFTSDHGYHLGEHNFWQKLSLHDESTRIPLIFAGPGIQAGTSEQLAQQIDIFPTLSELCGLPIPSHVMGRSVMPLLKGSEEAVHKCVYTFRGDSHAINTSTHAYLVYKDGSEEFYDMQADPGQFTNLVDNSDAADALKAHRALLKEKLTQIEEQLPSKKGR